MTSFFQDIQRLCGNLYHSRNNENSADDFQLYTSDKILFDGVGRTHHLGVDVAEMMAGLEVADIFELAVELQMDLKVAALAMALGLVVLAYSALRALSY